MEQLKCHYQTPNKKYWNFRQKLPTQIPDFKYIAKNADGLVYVGYRMLPGVSLEKKLIGVMFVSATPIVILLAYICIMIGILSRDFLNIFRLKILSTLSVRFNFLLWFDGCKIPQIF